MTGVSIVIPTLNAGPGFAELLGRLKAQRMDHPLEIIVIDSSSTDGTAAIGRRAGARVEIIDPSTFNHGATRDRAIALSSGELIVLLSQDAVPADDRLIGKLMGNFADARVAGAYARHEPRLEHDAVTQRDVRRFCGSRTRRESAIADGLGYHKLTPFERFNMCRFDNVCSAVRRSVWESVPFGRRDFAEDLDWSRRVVEAGWKIVYDPGAVVIHSHVFSLKNHYMRSYQTHRALRDIFGLQLVPSRRELLLQMRGQIAADLFFLWRNQRFSPRKLGNFAITPARTICTLIGAYRGGKSARSRSVESLREVAESGVISPASAHRGPWFPGV